MDSGGNDLMELTTRQDVPGLLTRSRLFTAEAAQSAYQRWLDEHNDGAGDLSDFARWLAEQQYVTEYQANLLSKGHAHGYFLDDYKILERIGRGRMAGVYKAVHGLGQTLAIKVLPPSRAKESELLGRFQREARLALRLRHPNVVRAFQIGLADGCHYLVMEYLIGETLAEVFQRRGRLPHQEALRLVHQLLLGLQHMHEQGFIHRDIKPANIMLVPAAPANGPDTTDRATLKILDIGLARVLGDDSALGAEENPLLTSAGAVLGTPDYMAPEQARDARTADIRADIYSAGCVLFHALTGKPPFPDTNLISQMVRHATEPPKPLREFDIAAPDGLQTIIDSMLAKEPGDRYETPEAAAEALHAFMNTGADHDVAEEADPQMKSFLNWLNAKGSTAPTTEMPILTTPSDEMDDCFQLTPAPTKRGTKVSNPWVESKPSLPPLSSQSGTKLKSKTSVRSPSKASVPNVQAVAVGPAPQPVAPSNTLTRRDILMMVIGAAGVTGAVLLGWGLSLLLPAQPADK
jgi:serine/threonine protein kinase